MKKQTKNILSSLFAVVIILGLGFLIIKSGNENYKNKGGSSGNVADNLIGKPAPSFSLSDKDGKVYNNDNLKGKNVVLFFNEGLMCYPACWSQMAEFGKDKRFNSNDIVAYSVIVDLKNNWQQAVDKMPELSKATVLFDEGSQISRKFNVLKTDSSMHYGSLPGHTYVIIDKNGIVRYVYDDPTMSINNDKIFTKVQELNK